MPPPLISLCSDGISFCEGDTPVILRGVGWPWFLWDYSFRSFVTLFVTTFKTDIQFIKESGANFVIIGYNPGKVGDETYVKAVANAVAYAHDIGLHVELVQHHSVCCKKNGDFIPQTIDDIDSAEFTTNVSQRWIDFLSHEGVVEILRDSVDFIGVFSEPERRGIGIESFDDSPPLGWQHWRPRAEKACLEIRRLLGREVICTISGVSWAGDIRGWKWDPFRITNAVLETHPYAWIETVAKIPRQSNWLGLAGNAPLLVGEFGCTDSLFYVQGLLSDFRENNISWAAWPCGIDRWLDVPGQNLPSNESNILRELQLP